MTKIRFLGVGQRGGEIITYVVEPSPPLSKFQSIATSASRDLAFLFWFLFPFAAEFHSSILDRTSDDTDFEVMSHLLLIPSIFLTSFLPGIRIYPSQPLVPDTFCLNPAQPLVPFMTLNSELDLKRFQRILSVGFPHVSLLDRVISLSC